MKAEIRRHGLAYLIYFGVITILRWQWNYDLVWLWLGGVVGYGLVFLDRLVYVYLLHPHEQLSQQVQYSLRQRNLKGALELLHMRRGEQGKLSFRSFLFVVAWVPLALFALTSTGEVFAEALVMGLGLHLVYDFWRDQQENAEVLNQRLFWQVKRVVSLKEQKIFLWGFSAVFVGLSLMLI